MNSTSSPMTLAPGGQNALGNPDEPGARRMGIEQTAAPAEVADGEGEALNDLIRLLEQRYRDMGDTLARKAATALRAAPSLSREEWVAIADLIDKRDGPPTSDEWWWKALRAKVREAGKS